MKQRFYKVFPSVTEETKDITLSYLVSVILGLGRYNPQTNPRPKAQKTKIAKEILTSRITLDKYLNKLVDGGYITTKPTWIDINGSLRRTTEFEILPRLQRLIEDKPKTQKPRNQETNTINKHISIVKTEDQKPNEIWQTLTEPIKQITALNPTIQ